MKLNTILADHLGLNANHVMTGSLAQWVTGATHTAKEYYEYSYNIEYATIILLKAG